MYNNEVAELADKTLQEIARLIPQAEVNDTRHSTCAGYSVYITVSYMKANMFVSAKLRISDHSVGCFRMQTDGCAYASNYYHCQQFIDNAVKAVKALEAKPERVAWISAGRRSFGKPIDINDYTDLKELDNLYAAKRKSDGCLVKIKKVIRLN